MGLALAAVKSIINDYITEMWNYRWEHNNECRQAKYFWSGPNKAKSKSIVNSNRTNVGRLARWLSVHAFLKCHNAIVNREFPTDPLGDVSCRKCKDPDSVEDPHHIITDCPYFWSIRMTLGGQLLDEYPEWDPQKLIVFLNYCEIKELEDEIDDINRFEFEYE